MQDGSNNRYGHHPGSVGNTRSAINKDTLGSVIAVSVPTVVDIATIVLDIAEDSEPLPRKPFGNTAERLWSRRNRCSYRGCGQDYRLRDKHRIQKGVTVSEMDMFLS